MKKATIVLDDATGFVAELDSKDDIYLDHKEGALYVYPTSGAVAVFNWDGVVRYTITDVDE